MFSADVFLKCSFVSQGLCGSCGGQCECVGESVLVRVDVYISIQCVPFLYFSSIHW